MKIVVFLALLSSAAAQAKDPSPEYCTKEQQGTLEKRVNEADVVLTGTVIRLEIEYGTPWDFLDSDWPGRLSESAKRRPGSQPVGLVKLWRVVKGSLALVANETSGPQDLLYYDDSSDNNVLGTPVLKLYGVQNDQLCGSYVATGDTRIFFLKKYPDFRSDMDINLGVDSETEEFDLPADLSKDRSKSGMAAPHLTGMPEKPDEPMNPVSMDSERENLQLVETPSNLANPNDTISSESQVPPKKKNPGKKKKDKGKKKKRKERGGKKKRKGTATTKSGPKVKRKGRKKSARMKRKSSESIYGEWKRLANRPKRSITVINKVSRMNRHGLKVRRDVGPRSVLVLYSPPARISLANLNGVEEFAKTPKS